MDTRLRLAVAAAVALLPTVPLTLRLLQLQIMQHRNLQERAAGAFDRSSEEVVPRADIVDRHGQPLAQSIPVWTAVVDKRMAPKLAPEELSRLSAPLKLAPAELARRLHAGARFAKLKERLNFEEAQAVAAARVEGVGLWPGQERFYPSGELACSVLGQTAADGRALSGVELSLDARLSGKPRRYRVVRDGGGRTIYESAEENEPPPKPVALTLDRAIQFHAEELLAEAAAQFSIKSGVVAVQDPSTGELLAMASAPANPLKNQLVQDSYEPGSTFKVVTAAAALDEGVVRTEDSFFCENGKWELVPGVTIRDHEPKGELDLAGILAHSSNIGTVKVVERLGAARFYRYTRAFGFAARTGLPLPGETSGELRPLSDMNRVALAVSSYGYGVGVSALQILGAYSALANGGTLWEPQLIKDGRAPAKVRRVASEKTVETLREMLEGVVEHGTAAAAKIPGYRVAGKTGTSRKYDPVTKKYSTTQYNASFVGFLPAGKPLWTILIVIEDPKGQYYGAQVAAPLFAKLGSRLLALKGVPPDRTEVAAVGARAKAGSPPR